MSHPSPWVTRWASQWQAGQTLLDLACGSGRHARWLAGLGLNVTGVDRDAAALSALPPGVQTLCADLELAPWPLSERRFDVVLVANYLWRPRWAELLACVADWYVHETFALGQEQLGRPRNAAFLLRPGELVEVCWQAGLHVLAYEDGVVNGARVQRVAARRRGGALPLLESPAFTACIAA